MEPGEVFISYARADSDFVLKLAKDLRAANVNFWLDQLDIAAGERWDQSIQEALEKSETLLLVLTPQSVASQNVMDEVAYALHTKKLVVPLLHKSCDVPFRVQRLQHIDFIDDYDAGVCRLLSALHSGHPPRGSATPQTETEHPADPPRPTRVSPAPVKAKGGFNIGGIGGNASFSAAGDMVAGDKVTQTTQFVGSDRQKKT